MDKAELEALLRKVKRNIRVTKVVATRSVKGKKGDYFAGFAAAWNSVQDDASGPGADLDLVVDTAEVASQGMTLKEAVTAHMILSLQADIAAYGHARADNAMTSAEFEEAVDALKTNHATVLHNLFVSGEGNKSK